ncbi:MAG TPA: phosphatase PAP2 family protein [Acidimicrobiales bacterium]|nr:phosphatase PAP2 family protein [Acidimicrobiales bacterium]
MQLRGRWEDWRARPVRLRFWRELTLVVMFEGVYEWTSDFAGKSAPVAYGHALDQIRLERALGLFHERAIQGWALHSRLLIELADLFYATVHFILPVAALLWVFRVDPVRYLRWRDALAWTTAVALACFTVFPLMPPRMLPARFRIMDTMETIGGLGSWDRVLLKDFGNQFAAMPSLHVSWALWSVLALYPLVKRRWIRVLLVLDPIATIVTILITGNHYILDIFGGVAVLAIGYGLATLRPRYLPWRVVSRRSQPAVAPVPVPAAMGPRSPRPLQPTDRMGT